MYVLLGLFENVVTPVSDPPNTHYFWKIRHAPYNILTYLFFFVILVIFWCTHWCLPGKSIDQRWEVLRNGRSNASRTLSSKRFGTSSYNRTNVCSRATYQSSCHSRGGRVFDSHCFWEVWFRKSGCSELDLINYSQCSSWTCGQLASAYEIYETSKIFYMFWLSILCSEVCDLC